MYSIVVSVWLVNRIEWYSILTFDTDVCHIQLHNNRLKQLINMERFRDAALGNLAFISTTNGDNEWWTNSEFAIVLLFF